MLVGCAVTFLVEATEFATMIVTKADVRIEILANIVHFTPQAFETNGGVFTSPPLEARDDLRFNGIST